MNGTVITFNKIKGFAAIKTVGGVTVAELFSCEADIGDVITGNLENLGDETFYNTTRSEEFEVYVHGVKCSESDLEKLMG
ncbi:MAG: hypothetical protein ACC635_02735 [Acidiferrobacterales bacterium]